MKANEVINKLQGLIDNAKKYGHIIVRIEDIENVFSELKENEDERIRKALVDYLTNELEGKSQLTPYTHQFKAWIAWLEKQSKLVEYYEDRLDRCACENFNKGYKAAIEHQKEKQGEQKPAEWSEMDSLILDSIISVVEEWEDNRSEKEKEYYGVSPKSDWLKSLKSRVQPQPKQEWSEEDESILQGIWDEILANKHDAEEYDWETYDKFLDWLKSLKQRYTWKPSNEQMKALDSAIHCYAGISPTNNREVYALEIMKEQLKKLKEE